MNITIDWGAMTALLVAIAGLITAITTRRKIRSENRKADSEASEAISDAALQLIKPLKEELKEAQSEMHENALKITRLENNVRALETENRRLKYAIEMLIKQVREMGGNPCVSEWKIPGEGVL